MNTFEPDQKTKQNKTDSNRFKSAIHKYIYLPDVKEPIGTVYGPFHLNSTPPCVVLHLWKI
jgi:hypothetical protein